MAYDKKVLQERMAYLWKTDMPLCLLINGAIAEAERRAVAPPSSGGLQKYKRKPGNEVQAIQLMPNSELQYTAWGGTQQANGGDYLVRRKDGETYTVEQKSFAATYKALVGADNTPSGWYDKFTPVWAEHANTNGSMPTKEGQSAFLMGDYLCYNSADRTDGWCMPAAKFEALYELDKMTPYDV